MSDTSLAYLIAWAIDRADEFSRRPPEDGSAAKDAEMFWAIAVRLDRSVDVETLRALVTKWRHSLAAGWEDDTETCAAELAALLPQEKK